MKSPTIAVDRCHPAGQIDVSFEFFPPKTEKAEASLWASVERLAPLSPRFVSVTYGAGGSTRDRTHRVVSRIREETDLEPAAHLTCVAASRAEVIDVAKQYWQAGVRHIVALRGDPPELGQGFSPHLNGFEGSVALIRALKQTAEFEVSAAAYPEPHPDSRGPDADLDYLKAKADAGTDRFITQYFFNNDLFLRLRDRMADAGISQPLVPGILPVTNFAQVKKFSAQCGTSVPDWLADRFEGLDQDPETRKLVAAATAAEQCLDLHKEGISLFHFYTLNRADLSYAVCHMLGIRQVSASNARAAA